MPPLTATDIRQLLQTPASISLHDEGSIPAGLTPAAVLVPMIARDNDWHILLTRRTDHLHAHAGQIAFPGGRAEPEDDSHIATALRETEEEVGLSARQIDCLGKLPPYRTGTGFIVTPVVGVVVPDYRLTLDSFEVAEAFEVPLGWLSDAARWQRLSAVLGGQQRQYWEIHYGSHRIWGATAGMLRNLLHTLNLLTPPRDTTP